MPGSDSKSHDTFYSVKAAWWMAFLAVALPLSVNLLLITHVIPTALPLGLLASVPLIAAACIALLLCILIHRSTGSLSLRQKSGQYHILMIFLLSTTLVLIATTIAQAALEFMNENFFIVFANWVTENLSGSHFWVPPLIIGGGVLVILGVAWLLRTPSRRLMLPSVRPESLMSNLDEAFSVLEVARRDDPNAALYFFKHNDTDGAEGVTSPSGPPILYHLGREASCGVLGYLLINGYLTQGEAFQAEGLADLPAS